MLKRLILFLGGLIFFSNVNAQGNYIKDINTDPVIIEKRDTFRIYLKLKDIYVDSIKIADPLGGIQSQAVHLNGKPFSEVVLYDNGKFGDQIANDSIFTRTGFTYSAIGVCAQIQSTFSQIIFRYEDVSFYNQGAVIVENLDLPISIAVYDSSLIEVPNVTVINDTIQYTSRVINVKRQSYWGQDPFPSSDYWKNTGLFSNFFCDDNFIVIQNTTNPMPLGTGSGATFGPSSNFTEGIGRPIYDGNFPFIGLVTIHWTRPPDVYIVHEFLHKWAAHQNLYEDLATGHWGYIQMPSSGLVGPTSFEFSSIQEIGVDTFLVDRNYNKIGDQHWSKLELYLAGLVPLDSVDFPLTYIKNYQTLDRFETTVTGKLSQITKDQWIDSVGVRFPEFGPSVYNVAHVVFSNELLSPAQLSYFEESMRKAERKIINPLNSCDNLTIYGATGGRIELNVNINPLEYILLDSICEGETHSSGYSSEGTYTDIFPRANGCDSTRILKLTVLPPPAEYVVQDTICEGEIHSSGYSKEGTYTDVFPNLNGCDSTRVLELKVLPLAEYVVQDTICAGAVHQTGYSEEGTYTDIFPRSNDCDSVRILTLVVVPNNGINCNVVGVKKPIKITNPNIKIYPNPTFDFVEIEIESDNGKKVSIEMRDLIGRKIINWTGTIDQVLKHRMDLKSIRQGIYIIQLDIDKNKQDFRVVVSK
ncbi:T9SS type A sorting domain-containing protein [Fulvivirgaceae bacterium BMA10]|uniref:T9SS type A sorting domain-containing protein n=1 Tax=Splendidivirga corallicola TaxID=3051826 RepID=A0ABT8KVT7_9BACT|nr:T9SS type A sorting domain-containing protein [Fulvivirgaceae bacterium BMA10]